MKLILISREDIASMNIREELLDLRDWKELGDEFGRILEVGV